MTKCGATDLVVDGGRGSADRFSDDFCEVGFPYVCFAGGLCGAPASDLQSVNPEMWPLSHLYRLRSELIKVGVLCDSEDSAIQGLLASGLERVVSSLSADESCEPLSLSRGSLFSGRPRRGQRSESRARPQSPTSHVFSMPRVKSESNLRSRVSSVGSRSVKPASGKAQFREDSIWENVNVLMNPIEDFVRIRKYLVCPSVCTSPECLSEPTGPHYSTTLCRDPSVLNDAHKSKLVIPSPVCSSSSGNDDVDSHLHSRLVSAVVPLLGVFDCVGFVSEAHCPANDDLLRDLDVAEHVESTRCAECGSFGEYGCLSLSEKLRLELQYAGLESSGCPVHECDCPLLQDLREALNREKSVVEEANNLRRSALSHLESGQASIEERARRQRFWESDARRHFESLHPTVDSSSHADADADPDPASMRS